VYQRFRRWCLRGVWARLLRRLTPRLRTPEILLIDSTILRAHQHSTSWRGEYGVRAIGRSRGGLSTKIHVAVTPSWALCAHAITAGQRADIRSAPGLLRQVRGPIAAVVGDRAYDSDAFIARVHERGAIAAIPSRRRRRRPRAWSRQLYGGRHRVETYFARLKPFRRLSSRFEKRVVCLRGFLFAANIVVRTGQISIQAAQKGKIAA
jgi:transposase